MLRIAQSLFAQKTYPTGDKSFAVMQAFPAPFRSESDVSPFLMLDHFGPMKSPGVETNPDRYPIGWHPHRGMDICTYMVAGRGRHADSMGNRETFSSPGMQWISVGSGIEHAEGGGTPEGEEQEGFQIWINTPRALKMNPPAYGTHGPSTIPILSGEGFSGRLLAGKVGDQVGPFKTATAIEMIDLTIEPNQSWSHRLDVAYDNCILFTYRGSGTANDAPIKRNSVLRFDAEDASTRQLVVRGGADEPVRIMLFSGKRINEPIKWHGPFVVTTQAELEDTFKEFRAGTFPPVRVPWDYKVLSSFPKDKQECKSLE